MNDLGYSDLGCYGGDIDTPVLDELGEAGLRFSRSKERSFHLKLYKIAVDSKSTQIEKTILEASQNTTARVAFEPCEYTWGNDIKLKNVNDLTIGGSGPTIL